MSSNLPLIGIPCRPDTSGTYPGRPINAQNRAYSDAVLQAGGIPILIPVEVKGDLLQTLFDQVDGLIFSGGGDIDPVCYNEAALVDNLSAIEPDRDEQELHLIRMAIEAHKPFFAICRGIQVLNVAAGGNLWQDIASQQPEALRHDYFYQDEHFPRNYLAHEINLEPASLLSKILKSDRLSVNSLHHQAAKDIPSTLRVTGYAEDGIVEALEVVDHPFGLGVQWHPEELAADHTSARKLFRALVKASSENNRSG